MPISKEEQNYRKFEPYVLFSTELQRQQHPQLGRIPHKVWNELSKSLAKIHVNITDWLQLSVDEQIKERITVKDWEAHLMWVAMAYNHPELTIQELIALGVHLRLSPTEMLNDVTWLEGDTRRLEIIQSLTPEEPYSKENLRHYALRLQRAVRMGHTNLMQLIPFIEAKAPGKLQTLITENNCELYQIAAQNGDINTIVYLQQLAPRKLDAMIRANNFAAYRWAAANGHLRIIKHLEQNISQTLIERIKGKSPVLSMRQEDHFYAFRLAAKNGHLGVLKHLTKNQSIEQCEAMISAKRFEAFRWSPYSSNNEVMDYLISLNSPSFWSPHVLMSSLDTNFFLVAAQLGNLDALQRAERSVSPELFQSMLQEHAYQAVRYAAQNSQVAILRYLEDKAPHLFNHNTEVYREAYEIAAEKGHIEFLLYLEEREPEHMKSFVETNPHLLIYSATKNGHHQIIRHLMKYEGIWLYVANYHLMCRHKVWPAIRNELQWLKSQQRNAEEAHPRQIFDVEPAEVAALYHMAYLLVISQDPELIYDLLFLITIPAVQEFLRQNVHSAHPRTVVSSRMRYCAEIVQYIPYAMALNVSIRSDKYGTIEAWNVADYNMTSIWGGDLLNNLVLTAHKQGHRSLCLRLVIKHPLLFKNLASTFDLEQHPEHVSALLADIIDCDSDCISHPDLWFKLFNSTFWNDINCIAHKSAMEAKIIHMLTEEQIKTINHQDLLERIIHLYFLWPKEDVQFLELFAMLVSQLEHVLKVMPDDLAINYHLIAIILIKHYLGEEYDIDLTRNLPITRGSFLEIFKQCAECQTKNQEVFTILNQRIGIIKLPVRPREAVDCKPALDNQQDNPIQSNSQNPNAFFAERPEAQAMEDRALTSQYLESISIL